jgi:hypothetical protein
MIPAATSVCRPQNADPGTARREQGRHASRDPTSAENAWHFFLGMCEVLRSEREKNWKSVNKIVQRACYHRSNSP